MGVPRSFCRASAADNNIIILPSKGQKWNRGTQVYHNFRWMVLCRNVVVYCQSAGVLNNDWLLRLFQYSVAAIDLDRHEKHHISSFNKHSQANLVTAIDVETKVSLPNISTNFRMQAVRSFWWSVPDEMPLPSPTSLYAALTSSGAPVSYTHLTLPTKRIV